MYFAFVARHCARCPAGKAVLVPLFITIGVGIGSIFLVSLVVIVQLHNVEEMVKKLQENYIEHNAAGPIVRLLLNWLQATSLLSTIKLTPPDAVKDVSVFTDYAQGISTEWYFIACTLRLNVWMRFAFQLVMPIASALFPALIVLTSPGGKRLLFNVAARWRRFASAVEKHAAIVEERDSVSTPLHAAAETQSSHAERGVLGWCRCTRTATRPTTPKAARRGDARSPAETPESNRSAAPTCSPSTAEPATEALAPPTTTTATLDAWNDAMGLLEHESSDPEPETIPVVDRLVAEAVEPCATESSSADEEGAMQIDIALRDRTRPFDTRAGWWWNLTANPIALLREPLFASDPVGFAIPPDGTVRAEERRAVTSETSDDTSVFIRVAGKWGVGWAPITAGLKRIAASRVETTFDYEAAAVEPADTCAVPRSVQQRRRRRGVDAFTKVTHRFRTLENLCPEEGITRDVIAHVFPASTTSKQLNAFMVKFDVDKDGRLDWKEYQRADSVVRAKWRYRSRAAAVCGRFSLSRGLWGRFSDADVDFDGTLDRNEIAPFLPITLSANDAPAWIARFDRSGAHGRITISDIAALEDATRRDDIITIVGASMSMAIFVVYIRTSKAIMLMFSTETVEGVQYLKSDLGRLAYTPEHMVAIGIAAVYGAFFIIGIPIFGGYVLFLKRKQLKERRIQSIFGFLFIGYRDEAFFWEFAVLVRKICFLAVALFWEDAFLQSVVGLFVIVVSIISHMAIWPYEQRFLNIVELMSLFALFSLVVLSILLWYVQQPGKTKYLEVYETAVTLVLFAQYGVIMTLLVLRYVQCMIREGSAALIKAYPRARPILERVAYFERWAHWQVFKRRHAVAQSELWTYIAADKRTAEARRRRIENGEHVEADAVEAKKSRRKLKATLLGVHAATRETIDRITTAYTKDRTDAVELQMREMPPRGGTARMGTESDGEFFASPQPVVLGEVHNPLRALRREAASDVRSEGGQPEGVVEFLDNAAANPLALNWSSSDSDASLLDGASSGSESIELGDIDLDEGSDSDVVIHLDNKLRGGKGSAATVSDEGDFSAIEL
jgi:hypothetical protein